MKIELALFDLGSTLVYFQGNWDRVVTDAVELMSREVISFGYPINQHELIEEYSIALRKYYIDRDIDNIERSTMNLLDDLLISNYKIKLKPEELHKALNTFYDYTGHHWKLDDEAIPMLEILKEQGYHLGLISNASYSCDVHNQLSKNNLTKFFEHVLISAEVGYRKPHPIIFQKALDLFDVEPPQAIMIGDTLNADIIGSRRVGIKNIWIARWASAPSTHYRDDMIVPDRTIQRLSQIPLLLKNL